MSDPIDELLNQAIAEAFSTDDSLRSGFNPAKPIRASLLAAGYRIELDPDFLLQKGRDASVVLKE